MVWRGKSWFGGVCVKVECVFKVGCVVECGGGCDRGKTILP